ncbi:MAG: CHASE2 domain-containing protein [Cyanobacteria bacterium J06621_11]
MKENSWKKQVVSFLSFLGGGSPILLIGSASVVLLICIARAIGLWEGIELHTLDLLLRHRPIESADERVTILEITEADLQTLRTYPVPDDVMLQLLDTVESYEPRVIGFDFIRDLPVVNPATSIEQSQQATEAFRERLGSASNIVVVERIFEPAVSAPPGVPPENIGFADTLLDRDSFVRRSLLISPTPENLDEYHLSFTLQVATKYLAAADISFDNQGSDPYSIRLGERELFRTKANSGGYYRQDTGDNPVVLLNFRQNPAPFRRISLQQLMSGDFPEEWVKDRAVLIGITAVSIKDYVNSAALMARSRGNTRNPGLVPGVELQAHAISQLISAALDNRPILSTWPTQWEYFWIVASGLTGLSLVHIKRPISNVALIFLVLGSLPLVLSTGLILVGVWIPLFPAWLGYVLTGGSVLGYRLNQYEQGRKIRFHERQQILERSYNAIHNGPLQTLKSLIRQVSSQENVQINAQIQSQLTAQEKISDPLSDQPLTPENRLHDWISELHKIDTELRSIYEFMQREYLQKSFSAKESQIYLTQNYVIDLNGPLHELLHQVYQNKLQESATYFETIKVKISDFGPMNTQKLNTALKESILRFFEEALCNIEQHANGVSRLKIVCKQIEAKNVIRVVDNGKIAEVTTNAVQSATFRLSGGDGGRQANLLAKRLKGHFARYAGTPTGTVCELVWPIQPKPFWQAQQSKLAKSGK